MNQWLSVSEAAQTLDVSPRTIRRQCAAGTLPARRVGGLWQVKAESDKSANDRAAKSDTVLSVESDKPDKDAANNRPNRTTESDKSATDLTGHLMEEVRFLRATVEQLQRDGAEVRAALRDALKSKVPQLATGTPQPPEAAQIVSGDNVPNVTTEAVKSATKRDGAALTYGDIADALERRLNQ